MMAIRHYPDLFFRQACPKSDICRAFAANERSACQVREAGSIERMVKMGFGDKYGAYVIYFMLVYPIRDKLRVRSNGARGNIIQKRYSGNIRIYENCSFPV